VPNGWQVQDDGISCYYGATDGAPEKSMPSILRMPVRRFAYARKVFWAGENGCEVPP